MQNDRWGYGCSVADYDNDGWPDLYVGNYGQNRLYHNNHDGTFTDKAEEAGVALGNWSPGSTWGDYDGDGKLDLYVTGYVHFDRNNLPIAGTKAVNYASCLYRGVDVNCGPRGLPGEPDHLFHNDGNGKFTDVTRESGRGRQGQILTVSLRFLSTSITTASPTSWWGTTRSRTSSTSIKAMARLMIRVMFRALR